MKDSVTSGLFPSVLFHIVSPASHQENTKQGVWTCSFNKASKGRGRRLRIHETVSMNTTDCLAVSSFSSAINLPLWTQHYANDRGGCNGLGVSPQKHMLGTCLCVYVYTFVCM